MNDELYRYGVKGMKWGVRRKRESSEPRTNWGKNRQYAKQQDAENKRMWKETKAKVKSGQLSKKSAEYKKERRRYNDYNTNRFNMTYYYGMSKAARGKHMQKLGMDAKTPMSKKSIPKTIAANAEAYAKQTAKYTVASIATTAALSIGAAYLNNRFNMDVPNTPRLPKGDMINLKPRQYKVRNL